MTHAARVAGARAGVPLMVGVALAAAALTAAADRHVRTVVMARRLDAVWVAAVACHAPGAGAATIAAGSALASWQTIGGCGAGSATGIGGIKWIGRNVRGGLLNLQCQANYTDFTDGHAYTVNNQITKDLGDALTVGVVVPYVYKWIDDPYELNFDLSNQGLGDINVLATTRFGAIDATSLTLSVSLPTGDHDGAYVPMNPLRQDRQLGSGKLGAAFVLDHVIDNLWGPSVIGASGTWPGGANELDNYRAPSGSVYGYVGYLLGPLVPALGVSAIGYLGKDRDRGLPSETRPPYMASVNASLEWSSDWMAILAGVSVPYATTGRQPWTAGLGLALAPL